VCDDDDDLVSDVRLAAGPGCLAATSETITASASAENAELRENSIAKGRLEGDG